MARLDIDVEERARRRLFIIFVFCIVTPLLIFGTWQLLNGHPAYAVTDYILVTLLVSFLVIMRRMREGRVLFRLTSFLAVLTVSFWIYTGANKGYASFWALAVPPFSFFLLGKREGLAWSIAIWCASFAIFMVPLDLPYRYPYEMQLIVRHLSSLAMVILFTYHYEAAREQYRDDLQGEHQRLIEERNQLDAANLRLQREIAEREKMQEELNRHQANLEAVVTARTEELRRANRELVENERRYRLLADNVTDLIWATDLDLNFIYISPSIENMFGYTVEEAMHLSIDRWNTRRSFEMLVKAYDEALRQERDGTGDPDRSVVLYFDQVKKDGTVFPVEMKASFMRDDQQRAVGIVGISRDISERVRSEKEKALMMAQLAQAQKREAIGTLAGGLAHDFNNVLGGIIGSIDLVRLLLKNEKLVNRDEIEYYLKLGIESSHKSVNFIKQLLTLSARHELNLVALDITESLRNILAICKNSLPKSVLLDFHIPAEPLFVMAEPSHIEQIFLNLCINAAHAMTIMRPEGEPAGGTLTVTVDQPPVGGPAADACPMLRVNVSDTGVGIDSEILGRVFEPFFTTKKQDQGTGLGLATTLSIVKQHGGTIDVTSSPGAGSTFTVALPMAEQAAPTGATETVPVPQHRGEGTILVIDDEKFILDVAAGMLHRFGYDVLTASHPRDGIAIFCENYARISAVLLDLSMPGMSGLDVFREMVRTDPGVKVILSSGMIDVETREAALTLGIREIIQKPFSLDDLVGAVLRLTG